MVVGVVAPTDMVGMTGVNTVRRRYQTKLYTLLILLDTKNIYIFANPVQSYLDIPQGHWEDDQMFPQ